MIEGKICAGTINFRSGEETISAILTLSDGDTLFLCSVAKALVANQASFDKWRAFILEAFSAVSERFIGQAPEFEPVDANRG